MYFASLVLSLFSLIMAMFLMFAEPDSQLLKFFGDTELGRCMIVAMVLLLIGFMRDKR